ncbi:MAG: poly(R)-hydroxyalkanoic acid synthase subunit PhaE [Janthinobacterium lividum]
MSEEDPAQGFKALTDFWSAQGAALLGMQQAVTRSMTEGMQAMVGAGEAFGGGGASSPELAQASDAMMQLWSAATTLSTELAGRLTQVNDGSGAASEVLERITNPRYWLAGTPEMDDVLARMVDGPRLADLFDVERRYGNVMRRWTELRRTGFEHQRVLLESWMKASQTFLGELGGRSSVQGKPLEPKQIVALWSEIGNRQMLETQRSESFLRSQRDMIRASTELRIAQAEMSEHLGKQFGLPTRTEIDDVHRSLTEMRRELRRTRRELDALKQVQSAASAAAPAASSVGKLPAKPRQTAATSRKAR